MEYIDLKENEKPDASPQPSVPAAGLAAHFLAGLPDVGEPGSLSVPS
jgi:hypothetical protein